jgi:hypothetical protein
MFKIVSKVVKKISIFNFQTALPIVSFHYGFMYSNLQKASITIGPLECKGKSQSMLNGKSCHSLKLLGEPSGYYILETADKRYSRYVYRINLILEGK